MSLSLKLNGLNSDAIPPVANIGVFSRSAAR
jgi:hypothetical protein